MKKNLKIILLCLAALLFALGAFILYNSFSNDKTSQPVSAGLSKVVTDDSPAYYTAHRGFSAAAPENTLPAVQKAGEVNYFACEFDIQPTKDGIWVVMHDETIDRMTNGKGKIADYTYDELLQFNIKKGTNIKDYHGTKIPSLTEMLDECAKFNLHPMIEIKGGNSENIEALIEILEERDIVEDVIIISFSFEYLEQLRAYSENITLAYLVNTIEDDTMAKCRELGNIGVAFDGRKTENHLKVREIIDAGLTTYTWTIDDIELHDTLYELGVRYFTTNCITP